MAQNLMHELKELQAEYDSLKANFDNYKREHDLFEKALKEKEETEVRQANYHWSKTFDAIQDGIMILDADQQILQMNNAFTELLGQSKEEMHGRFCYSCVHNSTSAIIDCASARVNPLARATLLPPISMRNLEGGKFATVFWAIAIAGAPEWRLA